MALQYKATIIKSSNYFKVIRPDESVKKLCFQFAKKFIIFSLINKDKLGNAAQTVYAAALKDRSEFRFHINAFKDFETLLKYSSIDPKLIEIKELGDYEIARFELKMKKGFKLRDYQEPVYEYLIKDNHGYNKMVGMYTGGGKGAVSMAALAHLGMRTIVIVKPGYMQKWVDEFIEKMDVRLEEIMAISGAKELKAFCQLCEMDKLDNIKFIVLSNRTYLFWLKAYEEYGKDARELGYLFDPDELFIKAKAGVRLIDEVHQDFHLNFRCDLYTHCKERISLSATLDNYDALVKSMYELAYPSQYRGPDVKAPSHVATYAVSYYTSHDRVPKTTEYNQSHYSHFAYESWIMRDKTLLYRYMAMIKKMLDTGYIVHRKPGEKALIFAASIKFCTLLTEYLTKQYPHLSVKRFCENDPLENLHNSDIRISNVIKSGTAHDIKGLVCTVLTIAVNSMQSNLQIFGRLRPIPGSQTRFYYLTNQKVAKHKTYHKDKIELLKPRSLSFEEVNYPDYL